MESEIQPATEFLKHRLGLAQLKICSEILSQETCRFGPRRLSLKSSSDLFFDGDFFSSFIIEIKQNTNLAIALWCHELTVGLGFNPGTVVELWFGVHGMAEFPDLKGLGPGDLWFAGCKGAILSLRWMLTAHS